jgi:hypothetical protein
VVLTGDEVLTNRVWNFELSWISTLSPRGESGDPILLWLDFALNNNFAAVLMQILPLTQLKETPAGLLGVVTFSF